MNGPARGRRGAARCVSSSRRHADAARRRSAGGFRPYSRAAAGGPGKAPRRAGQQRRSARSAHGGPRSSTRCTGMSASPGPERSATTSGSVSKAGRPSSTSGRRARAESARRLPARTRRRWTTRRATARGGHVCGPSRRRSSLRRGPRSRSAPRGAPRPRSPGRPPRRSARRHPAGRRDRWTGPRPCRRRSRPCCPTTPPRPRARPLPGARPDARPGRAHPPAVGDRRGPFTARVVHPLRSARRGESVVARSRAGTPAADRPRTSTSLYAGTTTSTEIAAPVGGGRSATVRSRRRVFTSGLGAPVIQPQGSPEQHGDDVEASASWHRYLPGDPPGYRRIGFPGWSKRTRRERRDHLGEVHGVRSSDPEAPGGPAVPRRPAAPRPTRPEVVAAIGRRRSRHCGVTVVQRS